MPSPIPKTGAKAGARVRFVQGALRTSASVVRSREALRRAVMEHSRTVGKAGEAGIDGLSYAGIPFAIAGVAVSVMTLAMAVPYQVLPFMMVAVVLAMAYVQVFHLSDAATLRRRWRQYALAHQLGQRRVSAFGCVASSPWARVPGVVIDAQADQVIAIVGLEPRSDSLMVREVNGPSISSWGYAAPARRGLPHKVLLHPALNADAGVEIEVRSAAEAQRVLQALANMASLRVERSMARSAEQAREAAASAAFANHGRESESQPLGRTSAYLQMGEATA